MTKPAKKLEKSTITPSLIGTMAGRPKRFSDPEELTTVITSYFQDCEDNQLKPTYSGLAAHIGVTRSTLNNYVNRNDDTSLPVKKALAVIEASYEQLCTGNRNNAGAIFVMKNFGWSDKQEIEHTHKLEQYTDEQLDQRIQDNIRLIMGDNAISGPIKKVVPDATLPGPIDAEFRVIDQALDDQAPPQDIGDMADDC